VPRRRVLVPARATALFARCSRVTLPYAALACVFTAAFAQPAGAQADGSAFPRVRSTNATIAAVIDQASEASATFRSLLETINATDGIVYIEPGKCGRGASACLVTVRVSGPNRMVSVWVDTRTVDAAFIGLIGHELRHAIEVLGDPMVTSGHTLSNFYHQRGSRSAEGRFETQAAIEAGEAVRAEVQRYRPRTGATNPAPKSNCDSAASDRIPPSPHGTRRCSTARPKSAR